jgi:hypothetical protein
MTTLKMQLKKLAKGSGGDRYEAKYAKKDVVLYFPQAISRPDGAPLERITVTIEGDHDEV